jgi:DNA-binding response OmpR family regulator
MAHVLLVEDDPAVLHLLRAMADFGGFTSSQALSAKEALRRIKSESFDVILLDLGLPDLAGSQLIEIVRAVSDSPLIVLSEEADAATVIAALAAGADDFLAKPFMPREIITRMRVAIWRHTQSVGPPVKLWPAPSAPDSFAPVRTPMRTSMEDRLINVLHAREREVVPTREIIALVWGTQKKRTDKNLRVLVARARSRLRAEGRAFEIINEHGRGYRMTAEQQEGSLEPAREQNGQRETSQVPPPLEPAD